MEIIRYCTDECIRQQSGTASVYNMLNAYDWADWQRNEDNSIKEITVEFIIRLGMAVEPLENIKGIRRTPITIGGEVREPTRLAERLDTLIEAYYDDRLNPEMLVKDAASMANWKGYKKYKKANTAEDIFYYEYEQIHPFVDGNGRSGKILYNYLLDSMDHPKLPPNFFGSGLEGV